AIQPPGTSGYSMVGSAFGLLLALGFLCFFLQLVPLARAAWERRHYQLVDHLDSWTGGHYQAHERIDSEPPTSDAGTPARRGVPLTSPVQLGVAAAACVVALVAFFPQIVDASEVGIRYTHLDNAAIFFFGAMLGLVLGSLPAVSNLLGDRPSLGLATVIAAPTLMMLFMVPTIYTHLERNPAVYAYFLVHNAAFGLLTGLGATRLGLVTGRLMIILSIGMPIMFAAAMK
ncbi:MAG: hypothetical protein ACRDLE_05600, partial [Gaiellaceae bacterium]